MKNILYIESNRDGTIGGSYYCLLEIVKHLDRTKYNPIVMFHASNSLIDEFRKFSTVLLFKCKQGMVMKRDYPALYALAARTRLSGLALAFFQKTFNLLRYVIPSWFEIAWIMRKYRIDLVHLNDQPLLTVWLVAARLFGARCVSHLRGNVVASPFQKRMMRRYDRVLSISHSVTGFMEKENVDTGNFVTLHDGIDIPAVMNARKGTGDILRQEFSGPRNAVLIGLIGNIKAWKGQHVAVEAMRILKRSGLNVKCLVIGAVSHLEDDRNYYEYLQKTVVDNDLRDQVVFTGYRSDVPDLLSIVDLLIHTSVEPEPMGRVVLEGMLFSKPVIATAHGGPLEIIENGISGFLVPPADPRALAEKMTFLLTNPEVRRKIGAEARKRVERLFTIETNVKVIESIYDSLLASPGQSLVTAEKQSLAPASGNK